MISKRRVENVGDEEAERPQAKGLGGKGGFI